MSAKVAFIKELRQKMIANRNGTHRPVKSNRISICSCIILKSDVINYNSVVLHACESKLFEGHEFEVRMAKAQRAKLWGEKLKM